VLYVIDGNNLLHTMRASGGRPAPGRQTLCRLLHDWARGAGAEVIVVFDGPAPSGGLERQMQFPGLTARFGGTRDADTVIEELVSGLPSPTTVTVVTTDRALQHAVRYRRARCIDSKVFLLELIDLHKADSPPPAPTQRSSEKPSTLAEPEIRKWLEEFGQTDEPPPDDIELTGPW